MPTPAYVRVLRRVVDDANGCWIFQGSIDTHTGYGKVTVGSAIDGTRTPTQTHRVVYAALIGPIPAGHDLHHRCEVRACANPWHLTPIDHAEHGREHGREGARARWAT